MVYVLAIFNFRFVFLSLDLWTIPSNFMDLEWNFMDSIGQKFGQTFIVIVSSDNYSKSLMTFNII